MYDNDLVRELRITNAREVKKKKREKKKSWARGGASERQGYPELVRYVTSERIALLKPTSRPTASQQGRRGFLHTRSDLRYAP
jgi:hypothetical protein